jgi:hypothetical protein
MKTIIAATLVLASGLTQAQSFDYEKAVGSAELYSTLNNDQVVSVVTGNGIEFAYQTAVGSGDLFPTLIGASAEPRSSTGSNAFVYQEAVGNELDPALS